MFNSIFSKRILHGLFDCAFALKTLNIQKEKSRLQAELDRAQKEILLLKSREVSIVMVVILQLLSRVNHTKSSFQTQHFIEQ